MSERRKPWGGMRGTVSATGVAVIAGIGAVVGTTYLGYHKHVTGHAIKSLVPEWQVASIESSVPAPTMCAGLFDYLRDRGVCMLTTTAGGAAASYEINREMCTFDAGGRAFCTVSAAGGAAIGAVGGAIVGNLTCETGTFVAAISSAAEATGNQLQRFRDWVLDGLGGGQTLAYTQEDYENAGIGADFAAELAAANRCSPEEFLRRARQVHGPRGVGGADCDDLLACDENASCADNVARFAQLKQCIKARSKRDYCFGGANEHHEQTINAQLTNQFRRCIQAEARSCEGRNIRQRKASADDGTLVACAGGNGTVASAPSEGLGYTGGEQPVLVASTENVPVIESNGPPTARINRTYEQPTRGVRRTVEYDGQAHPVNRAASVIWGPRANEKEYVFPEDSTDRAVSRTGKTMCFKQDGVYHCHTSGTTTGFRNDWANNGANAIAAVDHCPRTDDGRFLDHYVRTRRAQDPDADFNVSGHSQGSEAVQVSEELGEGDQITVLQPAASHVEKCNVQVAQEQGANVVIAPSEGDVVSTGLSRRDVPRTTLPNDNTRDTEHQVHSAPNARDRLNEQMGVEENRTFNPAMDASVVSNPGSPAGPWRQPRLEGHGEAQPMQRVCEATEGGGEVCYYRD